MARLWHWPSGIWFQLEGALREPRGSGDKWQDYPHLAGLKARSGSRAGEWNLPSRSPQWHIQTNDVQVRFHYGRSLDSLVEALIAGNVTVSAPFLTLEVAQRQVDFQ